MEMTVESLKFYPIKCIKYNNSLDETVQQNYFFDAFITVSSDGSKLIISNKKPTAEAKEYILDADPITIKSKQTYYQRKQIVNERKINREIQ